MSVTTLAGQSAAGGANSQSPVKQVPGFPAEGKPQFGAALQKLIPDPAVYKFETGTGFEIRPVVQPDGHSIVYNFDYMYTTNVREPVRADEKHLGRVKQHFVHTDVQTSSFELREVGRYVVALKASRTSRGVPLLEDVPVAGAFFRPAPSDESSVQMNVILASSTIYPTQFDLMGLRWSPYADQVGSKELQQSKSDQAERRKQLRDHLINKTRSTVEEHIGLCKSPNCQPVENTYRDSRPSSAPSMLLPNSNEKSPTLRSTKMAPTFEESQSMPRVSRPTTGLRDNQVQPMSYITTLVSNVTSATNGSIVGSAATKTTQELPVKSSFSGNPARQSTTNQPAPPAPRRVSK